MAQEGPGGIPVAGPAATFMGRSASTQSVSGPSSGLDHRQNPGLQGLGQVGPGVDHGGQVGIILTSVGGQMVGKRLAIGTQVVVRFRVARLEGRS